MTQKTFIELTEATSSSLDNELLIYDNDEVKRIRKDNLLKVFEGYTTSTILYHTSGYTGCVQTADLTGASLSYTIKAGTKLWFINNPTETVSIASDITQNITNLSSPNHFIYAYWDGNQIVIAERSINETLTEFHNEVRLGTLTSDPTLPAQGIIRNSSGNPKVLFRYEDIELRFGNVRKLASGQDASNYTLTPFIGSPSGSYLTVNKGSYRRVGAGFLFGTDYSLHSNKYVLTDFKTDEQLLGSASTMKVYVHTRDDYKHPQRSGTSASLQIDFSGTLRNCYESPVGTITPITSNLTTTYITYFLYYYPVSRLIAQVLDTETRGSMTNALARSPDFYRIPSLQETVYVAKAGFRADQTTWTGTRNTHWDFVYV